MGGNRITSLGETTEPTDAVNRNFLYWRLTQATTTIKAESAATLSELTKTNNEKLMILKQR